MRWTRCPVGPIQANCYILEDEDTGDALIIDPGDAIEKIAAIVDRRNVNPRAVLLTHAHFDHIGALDAARDRWKIAAYLDERESEWLLDSEKNGSANFPMIDAFHVRLAEHLLNHEENLTIGPFAFQVLRTPGHSPGGLSFYFQSDRVVFCGDTLFNGSIGRTDGWGGDRDQLIKQIQDQLLTLPPETNVCPGHGFSTTVAHEAETNPFLI